MPRKKTNPAPTAAPNNPAVLTLAEAHDLKHQYRLSSLLTRADGTWRLFYSHECRAGYRDSGGWGRGGADYEQAFEDELQANQEFHRLRSEWLQETHVVAG